MIYLDSAATSLYKPETVAPAVLSAMRRMASPGRGAHAPAMAAAACCYQCRERLAELFHVPNPENVVFTFNATHGLNIAIRSLVRPGSRVLISGFEHNAVTRPLHALGAEIHVISTPLFQPEDFLRRAASEIRRVDAVICTHVSNVFGYILPIEALSALCRCHGKPLIIDASQSAGVLPLDFHALGADYAAMPGHKGLMGPQGTGVLLCKNSAEPLLYGGSGSESVRQEMPDFLPDRLEAGTHNVPGIAGLQAAVEYLLQQGTARIYAREDTLLNALAEALTGTPGLRLFYAGDKRLQCSVLSCLTETCSAESAAEALGERGVAVRSGLHCAPLAHETVGTIETGTVRFSVSPFLTLLQIKQAAELIKKHAIPEK